MKIYVLDANAVIRFLSGGRDREKVAALVRTALQADARLVISVINWGEVLYSLGKSIGLSRAVLDLRTMSKYVEAVAADQVQTEAAAAIRLHYRIGYADCFAAALAMSMNGTLVTADPAFTKLGKKLKLIMLAN